MVKLSKEQMEVVAEACAMQMIACGQYDEPQSKQECKEITDTVYTDMRAVLTYLGVQIDD